ncbi:MAG: hypothetical protein SPH11_07720 [Lentihominibacter sp.]|uniref:hypothetical protein n=1 Tax=Lentihominibacter sp. TaxID=2944216 RepID=UPI002A912C2C|nr:hypothetical protein [Lentihominibacter sp.]MDY5287623.1 hypothetical protein [Lentihominibacter sp.]
MKVQVKELQGTHRKSSTYPATLDLIGVVDWRGRKDGVPLYGVVFEEIKNPAGTNGRFYYTESELILFGEEDLEETKKLDFDWSHYRVARCFFNDGPKEYSFAITNGDAEKIKDLRKARGVTNKDQIVQVIHTVSAQQAKELELEIPYAELKAVFDLGPYEARKERRAKKAKIKKQMDERVKEIQSTQLYELLAEKDETLACLLREYTEV